MIFSYTIIIITIWTGISFASNTYSLNNFVILPGSVPVPPKGSSYIDTTTGATWTRRSNITEMGTALHGMIVYSRFSPTNSNGQYLLVHGTNSTSCYVYRLSDNVMVADLKRNSTNQIGEVNEIRWDYTGNYPNRVYFISGMSFYYMDVISGNQSPTLIRDFSTDFPTGHHIMNDVEGDSSSNSRYWAWEIRGAYDGAYYPLLKIFTYDKTANSIMGTLSPGDVAPTKNASSWTAKLPNPNMVEVSPDGTKVITHFGRSYTGSPTGDFANTYFDAPHAWDLNFSGTPVKISADETHSGWGYLTDGTQVFVSQDNTTDKLQYCRTDGLGGAWPNNCAYFMDHAKYGYFGAHFAKMPASKPGWTLLSTSQAFHAPWTANTTYTSNKFVAANGYIFRTSAGGVSGSPAPTWPSTQGATVTDGSVIWQNWGEQWPSGQLLMCELKPMETTPRIWRISPQYNDSVDYRSEGSAAISQDGEKIYVTGNWMNASTGHGEAYEIDISGWNKNIPPSIVKMN